MIYSPDINKICALCRHAEASGETHIICRLRNEQKAVSTEACSKFIYDIFKKPVHRKRRLDTNFTPEDFKL